MDKNQSSSRHRVDRNICLPITQEIHNNIIDDPVKFRNHLDKMIELFPELFPAEISNGYQMKDTYKSKKMSDYNAFWGAGFSPPHEAEMYKFCNQFSWYLN